MEIIFLYKVTLKLSHLIYIPLNIQTIQVLEVMVLKYMNFEILCFESISQIFGFQIF